MLHHSVELLCNYGVMMLLPWLQTLKNDGERADYDYMLDHPGEELM